MRQHLLSLIYVLMVVAVSVLGSTSGAVADDKPLRMVYEQFHPYSFSDADGRARGYSIDLMEWLSKAAGYEVEYIPSLNPSESLRMIANGEADLSALLSLTDERLELALATVGLGRFELRAFVHHEHSARNLDDLKGQRIGVVAGSFATVGASKIPSAQLVEYALTDDLVMPLLTGEIDAVVSDGDSFRARLRKADVEQQVVGIEPAIISNPYGFFISKEHPEVQTAFNEVIRNELNVNALRGLDQFWFGRPKTWTDYQIFWWILGFASFVAFVLIYVSYKSYRHKKNAVRLLKENKANGLLVSALDEVAAAIVIFDKTMRCIHWNKGFEQAFPSLVKSLKLGATMQDLIRISYRDGTVNTDMNKAQIEAFAEQQAANVRASNSEPRTVYTASGTAFEARDFKLGDEHFASIRVDVTQRQAQQNKILEQSTKLEKANDQLTEFSAIAAHDLKSPLIRQKMLMDVVASKLKREDGKLPEDIQRQWGMIERVTARMTQLIEDLLDYAMSELDVSEKELISPSETLKNIAEFFQIDPALTIEIEPDIPEVRVHVAAFEAVMRNLISNAIKHHDKETGTIRVNGETDGDSIVFRVTDDGPGVPDHYKESVFEPFKRLTNKTEGSGLGLAYIQKTVENWGGRVDVSDAHPRGSVFSVTIPLSSADQADRKTG